MIAYKQVNLYNWNDLQQAICEDMGIDNADFYSYHKIIGGDYKNLWHVALDTFIPHNMSNDTIVTMFPVGDQIDDDDFWLKDREWARPMIESYAKIMKKIDPDQNGILVNFSW